LEVDSRVGASLPADGVRISPATCFE
jgi:hypothetical protein